MSKSLFELHYQRSTPDDDDDFKRSVRKDQRTIPKIKAYVDCLLAASSKYQEHV